MQNGRQRTMQRSTRARQGRNNRQRASQENQRVKTVQGHREPEQRNIEIPNASQETSTQHNARSAEPSSPPLSRKTPPNRNPTPGHSTRRSNSPGSRHAHKQHAGAADAETITPSPKPGPPRHEGRGARKSQVHEKACRKQEKSPPRKANTLTPLAQQNTAASPAPPRSKQGARRPRRLPHRHPHCQDAWARARFPRGHEWVLRRHPWPVGLKA